MRRLLRSVFRTGRHHVRTAPRDRHGDLVTVSTIAARLRREARERAIGSAWLPIVPDIRPFDPAIRRAIVGIGQQFEAFA